MILFKKDWEAYPSAVIHYETKNSSFLRISALYKAMGVENHTFPLALHNPDLRHIDPYSEDLTPEEIYKIVVECKENPWYFFREVIKIPATGQPDGIPFIASRGNISMAWLFFNHVTQMLIMPRQTGKTMGVSALMVYLFGVACLNTDINLLTKDDQLRVKTIAGIKDLIDDLPYYLKLRTRKDANNTEKLTLDRLGNKYYSSVGQSSYKAALNLGRGMTIAINHIDEIAFVANIEHTLPALLAAASAARENAKKAGNPYGNIFTTTAGYLSNPSGRFAYKIYSECCRWTEKLLDCEDLKELVKTIKKNSPVGKAQVLCEFNHRQLGFTDEWLAERIEEAMSEGENAEADFLNIWAEGSESSPISKENLAKINKSGMFMEPYVEISTYGYITKWYVKEQELEGGLANRKLIMGLDTSDAVGNDDIGMCIRDSVTAEVLACGKYNETNLISFAEWLVSWLERFPNLTIVIERRSSGVAIIDHLLLLLPTKGIDPFKRLFNWVVNEADGNPIYREEVLDKNYNYRSEEVYTKYRKHFGYATSGSGRSSRDNLYGLAFNASIKYTSDTVRDKTLIKQLTGLIRKNDRIDHPAGEHDDLCVGWLLGYWFLSNAKNTQYYGLEPRRLLSAVNHNIIMEQGGYEAIEEQNKQVAIKEEIDNLIAELRTEQSEIKSIILINKIKHKYLQLKDADTSFNIEGLIKNIETMKKVKRINNFY